MAQLQAFDAGFPHGPGGLEILELGHTRYTSNAGLKELRIEISRYLERSFGLR